MRVRGPAFHPARWPSRWPARGVGLPRPAPQHELARILRRRVALLLEEASLLRIAWSPFGCFVAGLEPRPVDAPSWRLRARDALALCAADPGASRMGSLLASLCARAEGLWPGASQLVRTARRVEPGRPRRLPLARALLSEGAAHRARAELTALLAADPPAALCWRAYAGLARAHEQDGNERLALGAADRAGDVAGCGAGPMVDSLFLALVVGDHRRALRAGARLDLVLSADAPELARAIDELCERLELLRGGLVWSPPATTATLARALARGPASPAGRVVRAVLGGAA